MVYATNNASRPPEQVAAQLDELGLASVEGHVLNSSVVGARVLQGDLEPGSVVLAIGGAGVADALRGAGLDPVTADDLASGERRALAVLQGYGPEVRARDLAEAAYAVQAGARWVVTNDDRTLPTDRGIAPGNGTLVAAVRAAVNLDPEVVGKPGPLMYELAARLLGTPTEATLGIGDRLETDIAGAHAAGMSALLVFTGVHQPVDVVAAPPELRPRFVARDLQCLSEPYDEPQKDGDTWRVGSLVAGLRVGRDNGHGARGEDRQNGGGHPDTCRVVFEGEDESLDAQPAPESHAESISGDVTRLRIALRLLWEAIDDGRVSTPAAVQAVSDWQ